MKKAQRGFTLIELMITVAVVAILAAIAYPSYLEHVRKGRRAAAQAQMMDIANREQQFLMANRAYAGKSALEASGYVLPSELNGAYTYDVAVATGTPPGFTITFTPAGNQSVDGALTLTNTGAKGCVPSPCASNKNWQ